MTPNHSSQRWLGYSVAALLMLSLVTTVGVLTAASQPTNPCVGTLTSPANGTTVISVQGMKFAGGDSGKKPARLIGVGPTGEIEWVHKSGKKQNIVWSYDVDPLENGNLFVTATKQGSTVFYEFDPRTQERLWTEELDLIDTHDADLLSGGRILIANMRNYNGATGENNDRIFIYNRTSGQIDWEWRFANHYNRSVGGNYTDDWTHVNDVDRVAADRYLVSLRNFDQVIVVNRMTGEITRQLGADDEFSVLKRQHNPTYLEGANGMPTVLVADSEHDRIVEYAQDGDGWTQTWAVGNASVFDWPRDADRLPNGNTLIADSANHRVIEVTPQGGVVWEFYAPWLVYDVARIPYGDEPRGPTAREFDVPGTTRLTGAEPRSNEELMQCDAVLSAFNTSKNIDQGTTTTHERQSTTTPKQDTVTETATRNETNAVTEGSETTTATGPGLGIASAIISLIALSLLMLRRT